MENNINAAILVLGDLNRSPRMLNHCKAISNISQVKEISLVGFNGGDLRSDIALDKKIKVYYIPQIFNNHLKKLPRFLFLFSALIKIVFQIIYLIYILLFQLPKFKFLILQNPPGIPSIYICQIICFLRRSNLIIDWHNYGYTILQVNGRNRVICWIAKIYEKLYGKCAKLNFCVSESMKKHLKEEMGIDAVTLPDRAIKNVFHRLCVEESHLLFKKYGINNLTQVDGRVINYTENRPLLMVSSTSWTPDEDFNVLLESFIRVDKKLSQDLDKSSRKVIFLITGRGPMKDEFMKKVADSDLNFFNVQSIWLESDDYPKILGSADLGICLHYSSSGFDLPMKVVDMFSAGLPVAAVYYAAINELVQSEFNGFIFKNSQELDNILYDVIKDFTLFGFSEKINLYRNNLKMFEKNDWVTQWKNVAYPAIIDNCINKKLKN